MKLKVQKFLIVILLAAIILPTVFSAPTAHAQLAVVDTPANVLLSAIAASTASAVLTLGTPGATQGVVSATVTAAGKVCDNVAKLQEVAATADSFSSMSLIGGSPAEATQITTKIATLTALKTCDEKQLDILKTKVATSLFEGQELMRRMQTLETEIEQLGVRIEQLKARQSAAFKDVLKAVAINLLLTYSQKLTTKVVNSIVNKYGIQNYLKYADAVASTVYTVDYVNKNFTQNKDKIILRGILGNNLMQNDVMPLVRTQAASNLGFDPGKLVVTDPNFYVKAASVGMGKNDAYYLNTVYGEVADQSKTQGRLMAQAEIAGGKGYIPVRNCSGAVEQQNRNDEKVYQVEQQIDFNQKVVNNLNAAYRLNPSREQLDQLQKAQAQLDASKKAYDNLPYDVAEPFMALCEGISNPGAFVGDTIQTFLQKKLTDDTSLKSENLPFYGKFIQSVASDFLSNIFTPHGKSDVQLLTEAGINATNITANDVVNRWDASNAQSQINKQLSPSNSAAVITDGSSNTSEVQFKALLTSDKSITQFQLVWDASGNTDVGFVTLGPATQDGKVSLQALQTAGSQTINFPLTAGSATYVLRTYGKDKIPGQDQPLESLTLTVTRPALQNTVNQPSVAGAFISNVPLLTRGPAVSPRGSTN